MAKNMKQVAILCPYPFGRVAGQRFRYEQYLSFLEENDVKCHLFPFLNEATNAILYQKGNYFTKIMGVCLGFIQRLLFLTQVHRFDYVFIYREITPLGPPIIAWLMAKIWQKKIIIDFDDAIWITKTAVPNPILAWLRNHNKIKHICNWSHAVTCGNHFLCDFARQFNENVIYLPTTLDTERLHNQTKEHKQKSKTIIGWTGSLTTLLYLDQIFPIIEQLAQQYDIEFHLISNFPPQVKYSFLHFITWQKETEIADLLTFDIGIMPMTDQDWEKGKCGFKALQYMALGIPAIVSPVGVNHNIVQDGKNGLLAYNEADWFIKLEQLIQSVKLRKQLGLAGQQTVKEKYSVSSQKSKYLALFKDFA